MARKNGKYVTYRWLITTIIAASSVVLLCVGAVANATFYPKAEGRVLEERSNHVQTQLVEIKDAILRVEQKVS